MSGSWKHVSQQTFIKFALWEALFHLVNQSWMLSRWWAGSVLRSVYSMAGDELAHSTTADSVGQV